MKIGIITFWWTEDNYGQLLQCYALQKYLRDHGHDAYLIRYDSRHDYRKSTVLEKVVKAISIRYLVLYLRERINKTKSKKDGLLHPRNFEAFRDEHIKQSERLYTSYEELKLFPPVADIYIVGSDQVWNFSGISVDRHKGILHSFFLDFGGDEVKRVSYAASWGRTNIDDKILEEISPLLQRFSLVTVREKSGLACCRKCGVEKAEWVCDPTMLLGSDQYRALCANNKFQNKIDRYVLFYYLGNDKSFPVKSVYDWAATRLLRVIYVSGNAQFDKYPKEYPTIQEWLGLIDHAEYVITNSFHCSIFSLLFRKKFGAIPLNGKNRSMNERMVSLFELLNIPPRFIVEGNFSCLDREHDEYSFTEYGLAEVLKQII
jgi:hypothetical protein